MGGGGGDWVGVGGWRKVMYSFPSVHLAFCMDIAKIEIDIVEKQQWRIPDLYQHYWTDTKKNSKNKKEENEKEIEKEQDKEQ